MDEDPRMSSRAQEQDTPGVEVRCGLSLEVHALPSLVVSEKSSGDIRVHSAISHGKHFRGQS